MRRVLDPGYEIEELSSREEAVELVRSIGDYDVVVVDIRSRVGGSTEELTGSDAIRELRKAEPALGIVAHGDRAERHLATQALSAGASAYVSRGAGPDELRSAVAAALEQLKVGSGSQFDPAVLDALTKAASDGSLESILPAVALPAVAAPVPA